MGEKAKSIRLLIIVLACLIMIIFLSIRKAEAEVNEDVCHKIGWLSSDCNVVRERLLLEREADKTKKENNVVNNNTWNTNNYFGDTKSKGVAVSSSLDYDEAEFVTKTKGKFSKISPKYYKAVKEFNTLNGG